MINVVIHLPSDRHDPDRPMLLPVLPRVGDNVEIENGGPVTFPVKSVTWDLTVPEPLVHIQLGDEPPQPGSLAWRELQRRSLI